MNENPIHYSRVLGSLEGLRRGITSGTCAQAAAAAAARMLLSGEVVTDVEITLKDGRLISIPVVNPQIRKGAVSCGVIKDAGDDDDVTHQLEFRAEVQFSGKPGVEILAGTGVGRVTKAGLPVLPGEPAVNPNPRRCIIRELSALAPAESGFQVTLSIPEGEKIAGQTWNPRLGIEGGLSILGTSGVVEPKSDKAYRASIVLALKVLRASGADTAALAFGYVGEGYFSRSRGWGEDRVVKVGDHIGFAMDSAAKQGFPNIAVAGHVGKMAKVASGLFDTHWTSGDARLETVAAWASAAGGTPEDARAILDLPTAEAAVGYLADRKLNNAWSLMNRRLLERCRLRFKRNGHKVAFESVLLDLQGHELTADTILMEDEE